MTRALACLLAVAVLASPTSAAIADLILVREAMGVLRAWHWNPDLDAVALVRAGVGGLRRGVQRGGGDPSAIAEIPTGLDETRTLAAFGERLEQAAALVAVSERQLTYLALRAMLRAVGGSHTYFLDPHERVTSEAAMRGLAYVGIGVGLTDADGRAVISRVIPGGPADVAGVRRGDVLVRVGATAVDTLDATEIRSLIVGEAGTPVSLTVRRGGRDLTFSIVRGPITTPVVEGRMLPGRVAYVKIYGYPVDAAQQIRDEIGRLLVMEPRGLVVDLRENSGGLIAEFASTMGIFVRPGTLVGHEIRRDGITRRITTSGIPIAGEVPIVGLIDLGTGSAGELTAAALKEQARAVLLGGRTAGVLETGITIGLGDGSGVSVAIARTTTGRGVVVEGRGYPPDVEVRADPASDQDAQLARAVMLLLQRRSAAARAA